MAARKIGGKVCLIVDGHPEHRAKVITVSAVAHADHVRLISCPLDYPPLTPDVLLQQDVKTCTLGESRPQTRHTLVMSVCRHLFQQQKQPHVIKNLFQQ
jgi:hypothetical protein